MGGNVVPGLPPFPPDPDDRPTIPDWNPTTTGAGGAGNDDAFSAGLDDELANPYVDRYSRESTQGDVHWKLATIEPKTSKFKNFTVRGQLPVPDEGITMNISNSIPEGGVYGGPHPIIQWVRGNLRTIQLPVFLYSRDKDEDIKSMFDQMALLTTYDKTLKRLPLCKFTFGSIVTMKCFVQGFGDVKIFRPTTEGKARRIEFSMTLNRFQPYEVVQTLSGQRPHESRMQMINTPEMRMYEYVALREWGPSGAIFGDRLRKRNRANPFYVPDGERTKVPSGTIILREQVIPEFHVFDPDDEDASQVVLDKFIARNARTLVV